MSDEIKVTKEFLERLNRFIELVNIPKYDNENDLLISLLYEYLTEEIDHYKEALEDESEIINPYPFKFDNLNKATIKGTEETLRKSINPYKDSFIQEMEKIEKEKPIRVNDWRELFDDELGDGEFGKKEAQKALEKCHNTSFDELIRFIQPHYHPNCRDCAYYNEDCSSAYNCSLDTDRETGRYGLKEACKKNFTCKNELTNFLRLCLKDYSMSDEVFDILKKYVKMYDEDNDNYEWWTEE